MEKARRHPGYTQETPRRHPRDTQEAPRATQEAPRRPETPWRQSASNQMSLTDESGATEHFRVDESDVTITDPAACNEKIINVVLLTSRF